MKLRDKYVLVTGASKGIGKAIALGMAREGAHVAVNYNTDKAGADEVVDEITTMGRKSFAVQADISDVGKIKDMFRMIAENFGTLDVLINNAGITGWTDLFEMKEEKWDQVIDTNLKGTFFCSLEAARMMKIAAGGSIVNISTICAELGVKNLIAYASSKGGIHAMTKQMAVELAPYNIRVNAFGPGATNVDRNLQDDPSYKSTWGAMVPLGRTGDPEDMVGPAVFLASDDSAYMTGQLFFVDGGWTVRGTIPESNMDIALNKHR
ncbi:SDR family NAD(P)-dependent oxidoreductase [Paenibacillus thermotolerans]|uniref:SDR family NAD(P)-dependent oxidoreductase n=1 Tax=Paenibacillus thermotolerans TaxID=3027807 RepID=UPI0023683B23|nr:MULTISPECIES: 3-oxoacyl-ACP reductase family protein [unclassified Paenibacillus]